jgi:hypothetical protein
MSPTVVSAARNLASGLFAAVLFVPGGAFAQADTALARQVYAEVNARLAALSETRITVRRPGVAYDNELRAWSESGVLRKIESVARDDSGDVVVEYYFGKGQEFVFAYTAVKGWDGPRQVNRIEQRQYFDNGKLVKWLGGREAKPVPASDPQYAAEGRARLEELAAYVPAIRAKGPPAPAAKAGAVPGTVVVGGETKRTTGTIVRMENGDIACYLHLKDERGADFTELGDFDLCLQEKRLVGRRVALTYQAGSVQSEECQGDPDCRKSKKIPLVVGAKVIPPEPAR